jgi:hypothetical protein
MACEMICDGCGKREPAYENQHGDFIKPREWFQRSDKDGIQLACSRECIKITAARSGKTGLVAPI